MANIIRREMEDVGLPVRARFEPLHFLRGLLPWDPFRELQRLGARPGWLEFSPDLEVKETADAYVVKADVPGVKEQDIDISVSGNQLTISGKREEEKEEKGENYYACERSYGSFSRSFTLPEGANTDEAKAEVKEGVLTLHVPKKAGTEAKKIAIGAAKGKTAKA